MKRMVLFVAVIAFLCILSLSCQNPLMSYGNYQRFD